VFERFTDRARRVLVLAREEARLLGHGFIGTEHILLGLIHEGEGVAAKALDQLDISLEDVRERVEETNGLSGTAPTGSPPFTPRAKKCWSYHFGNHYSSATTGSGPSTCFSASFEKVKASALRFWAASVPTRRASVNR
jgi:ATP-dependent Clp protease ATP-binding subunit ClpA